MAAVDAFSAAVTSVQLSGPSDLTGLERIMLVAQGDLQRLLSAYFGRPITIAVISAHTSPQDDPASPSTPITQERRVRLVCGTRTVCVASSRVTLTAPEPADLLLRQRFAIGQVFRAMRRAPAFELLHVSSRLTIDGRRELVRTYRLSTEGCECEIEEVFPDRDMFILGELWLDMLEGKAHSEKLLSTGIPSPEPGLLWKVVGYVFPWLSRERAPISLP